MSLSNVVLHLCKLQSHHSHLSQKKPSYQKHIFVKHLCTVSGFTLSLHSCKLYCSVLNWLSNYWKITPYSILHILHTPYSILLHTTYDCILHSTMSSYCNFTRSAIPMHSNGSKPCSSPHAMCVCPVSRGGLATLCREHTGDRILMAVFTLPNRVLAVFTFQGPGCACAPKNRSWLCLFSLEFVLCRC